MSYHLLLQIAEVNTHNMTHENAIERILMCFQRHEPAPLLVRYNAKGLSQLPTNAKDNFYIRLVTKRGREGGKEGGKERERERERERESEIVRERDNIA